MQDYDVVLCIVAFAKTVTPGGSPRESGAAGWFLPGGISREAGPIKHQLVLECRSGGSARKNQSRHEAPIAYTNLLPCVAIQFYFNYLIINQSVIKIVF